MKKNKSNLQPRDESSSFERKIGTREERNFYKEKEKIVFSYKDLDQTQPPKAPESILLWEEEGQLASLFEKLVDISRLTLKEAISAGIISVYDEFPENSDFFHPKHIVEKVKWAVIKNIGGQKGRIAGYIKENVFYIVFLDKNHRFWITEKKNT
jgi:hypothetical protein